MLLTFVIVLLSVVFTLKTSTCNAKKYLSMYDVDINDIGESYHINKAYYEKYPSKVATFVPSKNNELEHTSKQDPTANKHGNDYYYNLFDVNDNDNDNDNNNDDFF